MAKKLFGKSGSDATSSPRMSKTTSSQKSLPQAIPCATKTSQAGSELRLETILSILSTRDEIVREALAQGSAVQDGCVRMAPRVSGTWLGAAHAFDPETHKIGLDVSPSAEMRATLETVGVEMLGEKNSGEYIGLVTDAATGTSDGTITLDEDVIVTGDKIKIASDEEAPPGRVLCRAQAVTATRVTRKLTENTPKKLIFHVPALATGVYTLKVVTRYSNSSTLIQDPREIIYEFPLTIGEP